MGPNTLSRKGVFSWLTTAVLMLTLAGSAMAQDGLGESISFVDIHGYADLSYFDFQTEGDPELPYSDGGGVPTFDNNHVTLFFGANITQRLKFISEFHYEHSFQEPELPQAVIQWKLAEPLVITFGRFWMPFGTLGKDKIYIPTNAVVSFPYTVSQGVPFHLAENGLKVEGTVDRFGYQVALVNGFSGLDEDAGKRLAGLAKDNNQNKRVYAHVDVRPVSGLEIGGSYTNGKWDDQNMAAVYFWGIDLEYLLGPVEIRGEYLKGRLENPDDVMATIDGTLRCNSAAMVNPDCEETDALRDNFGPLSEGNHNRQAYFVLVSYRVLDNQFGLQSAVAIVRIDGFMRDEAGDAGDRRRVTLGINVSPEPHLHLKGEYQWVSEPGDQKSVKNNGVMLQAVADF